MFPMEVAGFYGESTVAMESKLLLSNVYDCFEIYRLLAKINGCHGS
jgi:hypothetical protein